MLTLKCWRTSTYGVLHRFIVQLHMRTEQPINFILLHDEHRMCVLVGILELVISTRPNQLELINESWRTLNEYDEQQKLQTQYSSMFALLYRQSLWAFQEPNIQHKRIIHKCCAMLSIISSNRKKVPCLMLLLL